MPKKKKKISELALADSLTGLYTIGCKIIDGIQTSVKVSLGTIQTAYENMLTEISNATAAATKANTAATNADNARVGLETLKANTEKATRAANTAANLANDKAVYANTQGNFAKTQGDRAQELADHPWKVGDNGNWWKWDLDGDRYVDTGILAKGGVLYPTFTINPADMTLVMSYEDEVSPNLVKLNQETGELYLNV